MGCKSRCKWRCTLQLVEGFSHHDQPGNPVKNLQRRGHGVAPPAGGADGSVSLEIAHTSTRCAPPPTEKAALSSKGSGKLARSIASGVRYPAVNELAPATNIRRRVVRPSARQVSPSEGTLLSKMMATKLPKNPATSRSTRRPNGTPNAVSTGRLTLTAAIVATAVEVGSAMGDYPFDMSWANFVNRFG